MSDSNFWHFHFYLQSHKTGVVVVWHGMCEQIGGEGSQVNNWRNNVLEAGGVGCVRQRFRLARRRYCARAYSREQFAFKLKTKREEQKAAWALYTILDMLGRLVRTCERHWAVTLCGVAVPTGWEEEGRSSPRSSGFKTQHQVSSR